MGLAMELRDAARQLKEDARRSNSFYGLKYSVECFAERVERATDEKREGGEALLARIQERRSSE